MFSRMSITTNGDKVWWGENGKRHREGAPAIECANGTNIWYLNGKCHRTDGPAIEYPGGHKSWYLYGYCLRVDDWIRQTDGLTEEEKVMFKLKYG
jgi:hypothetical protein